GPLAVRRLAFRADGAGRPAQVPAMAALLHEQGALAGGLPERGGQRVGEVGQRLGVVIHEALLVKTVAAPLKKSWVCACRATSAPAPGRPPASPRSCCTHSYRCIQFHM